MEWTRVNGWRSWLVEERNITCGGGFAGQDFDLCLKLCYPFLRIFCDGGI